MGRVINDRFRVIAELARGGMGVVYEAEQLPLGRSVALKVLLPRHDAEQDAEFNERFFLEAAVASRLHHPNTVTIFDYGRTNDGVYFIAMELLRGRSLHAELKELVSLPADRVVHIASQIARSLREAHRGGVVHRDLKPANVLLVPRDEDPDFVKVLDFGLVKALNVEGDGVSTQTGMFLGSPRYMSPEQIRGEAQDGRSDVYALGVLMYHLLSGGTPFDDPTQANVLIAHVRDPAPAMRCPVPRELSDLVMDCLEKSPDQRPASMDEVLTRLKGVARALGTGGPWRDTCSEDARAIPLSTSAVVPSGTGAGVQGQLPSVSVEVDMPSKVPATPAATIVPRKRGGGRFKGAVAAFTVAMGAVLALYTPDGQPVELVGDDLRMLPFTGQQSAGPGASLPVPEPSDPAAVVTEAPKPSAASAPLPEPEADAPEARLLIQVTSSPPGARVTIDGTDYGTTPAEVERWGDRAKLGRTLVFELTKEGFRGQSLERVVGGDRLDLHVELARRTPRRRRPRVKEPAAEPVRAPRPPRPSVPRPGQEDDFKEVPY